jgi:HJR/Mrr/RecB family endonuclease
MKDRCRCGNLVPKDTEFKAYGGTCRACARERQEKKDSAQREAEFEERKAYYLSQHPFWSHIQ